jgi:hypothetical protein
MNPIASLLVITELAMTVDISEAKRSFDFFKPKFILDERSEAIIIGVELL